jgi:hypothetical protein
MAMSPDQWLDRLARRMDNSRSRLALLRSYMDGCAPLPEGAEGVREAYRAFQKKARTNVAELIVDAVGERIINAGFRVGESDSDDDQARSIWRRNRMQIGAGDTRRDMLGLGCGYNMVWPGPDGAVITSERPEQVYTEHDPRRPDMVRAGVKVYRDDVAGVDVAYVHLPGAVFPFMRDAVKDYDGTPRPITTVSGGWKAAGSGQATGLDMTAIVPYQNRGGLGEFEPHVDILDRINWVILQRLVITAMQAYRQRATKGDLPEVDEQGRPIDYAEMFKPGPGALWQLPDGVELWESQVTDLTSVLMSAKDDFGHLAAVTRTPMAMLMPDGQNQSAEGASFAKEGLIFKSGDRVQRVAAADSLTMGLALAIERGQSSPVDCEALYLPVERQSLAERYDAASKAGPAGVPWRTVMTDVLQFPADQVDRMETERASDALLTAALAPPVAPTPAPGVTPNAVA